MEAYGTPVKRNSGGAVRVIESQEVLRRRWRLSKETLAELDEIRKQQMLC